MDLAGKKRRELQALCKRRGLAAGGTNAGLVARLDAALSGGAGAAEGVAGAPAAKGCLKQTGRDAAAEAKKVTFAAEEGRARRLRTRVIWSPVADKAKTRGRKSAQTSANSAAAAEGGVSAGVGANVPVRRSRRSSLSAALAEEVGEAVAVDRKRAAEDGVSAEVGVNVPVRRSRRNSLSAALAEEVGEAVAVDRKRKRKNQDDDEGVAAVSAQVGVSSRVTRRSSLAVAAAVLPPAAVEKKRGRGKAAGGSNKLVAEVQDSEPDVQKSPQVEASARVTRSRRSIAPVVMSPNVVENKRRRKTGDSQANVELPTVSDVPRNEAPVTRSLRSRVVQVNSSMVAETHTSSQLESKTQPSRPPTLRHQQVSSSVEDKNQEQTAAPKKAPILRCSGRKHSEDAEKQLEVKEPVKRSTRKSVVLATLEKGKNDLIEEKNPAAHVRKSARKLIVPVKDAKGIGEKIHNANREDVVKQPAPKGPVRGLRRKSVVPELHEKEKGLIAEKNMEAHEGKSKRKHVMPVKDIKAVGEGIQNAKGKDVEKQFVVKQPTRRSSRKSVLPNMLENSSGLLAEEMNAEMNVRRSTRKSVLPNISEEQDHNKMTRNENFQSDECQDDERQQKVKEPIRRSRRSVAAVPLKEQSNGLHEEKMSKNPMRRSTRKSIALNEDEKVSLDNTEIVAREPERVGEEGLKLRKHRRSSLEISSLANDSWRKQQNTQIPNEKDNTGGRSSKRRRTTASEEVRSVKEANEDIIIREATKDAHEATQEYKESGSRVQESGQINVTREEHSSGPLLVTVTLPDKISNAQSVPVVMIPGSESGDNANESSDKSKQEHSNIQAVDSHLFETNAELDQSSCIAGLALHSFDVSEDKSLMSKDGLSIDFTVGDREERSPVFGEGRLGLEANASEPGEKNLANVKPVHLEGAADDCNFPVLNADKGYSADRRPSAFGLELLFAEGVCTESYSKNIENIVGDHEEQSPISREGRVGLEANASDSGENNLIDIVSTDLYAKQHDTDIIAEETDKDVLSMAFPIEEHGEKYAVSAVAVEKSIGWDTSACESAGKPLTDIFSNDLDTIHVQHDCDVLSKETGEASGSAPPISESHTNTEIQCNTGESIQAADLGKCPSRGSIGNPYPTSLHLEGAVDDCILPVLNADKGCSSDRRSSSFGLELMFAEACKESFSKNTENTDVEIVDGNKHSTPVTPGFYVESVCLGDEDVQPSGCDADKNLSVDQGIAREEVLAQEKSNDQHVLAKTEQNMKLNDELAGSGLRKANLDERVPSVFSLDAKHIEVINSEEVASEGEVSKKFVHSEDLKASFEETDFNGPDIIDVTPGIYLRSDCLEDEDGQPTRCDADKKLDIDKGVVEEEVLAQEKSNDQHVPAKTDLNMKLNDELASPCTESGCSITEKNTRPFTDNLDQQAIFQVQQGDVQEGDLKKPSPCSTTPECKHKYGFPEETLSSVEQSPFGLESLFSQENIDESMGSATAHTKDGFDDSKDCHVKSALENTHVSKPYSLNDIVEGISKNDDCMQTPQHHNGMEDAIENPSICLVTTGYKHEDALSEEAAHTLKDYAGTCSSNPRELLMDLQSLFSKGNIKESHPDDGLAFPSAENSDQSISVEQRVKVHHGSNLSHLGSTDLLDELIGCSNTEVLHQSHNHEDRSNMDRVEQVASEPCTNDIVEAAAAECIESGLVLLPSEERSNLNDGQLNPKLESPTNMGSGLNCDKYVCNTSANGSVVVVGGERTPSGSSLPEDSPKDHYPRQELLDGCSVESSLEGTICRKKIVSAVAGIGSPPSLATHDYNYESALSKESACRMKNYTGMSSVDPKHLIMEMRSPPSEGSTEKPNLQDNFAFKYEGALSKEAVYRMKNYTGMSSVDPKHLIMEMQSPHSEGSTENPDLQDNLAFPRALNGRDEPVVCHVEELLAPHVSSEPDTCQHPCEDLSRYEEKESCMKGSLTPVRIDLADDAHLIERDIVDPVEVSCEEKVEIKCMPTSGSDILQEKSYSNGHGICQSHSQKHIVEANFRLSSCGTDTEVLHQDHKEEFNEPNEGKFSPKALVENNMSEDAPIEGIMLPLVAGMSEIHDEQLNTKMSDESEELCFSSDKNTIENFCLYSLPKDFHTDTCQKQEVQEVLSLPESAEESAKFQCVSVSGSGPCQQRVNESTSMQATYTIELVNLDHKEYNQNNEDQTTPGVSASSVPEAVEIEIEQSEMEIGPIPATETSVLPVPEELEGNEDQITPCISASSVSEVVEIEQSEMKVGLISAAETLVLPVPDEQPNSKLEGNKDQITPGISASSVPEAVEIEQSEMKVDLISAAGTSVLRVPDVQPNSKLEGNEVDEHSCSYDKDFFILSDSESLKREASSLNKDDCMDLSSEDNHPNDLPAPKSPEPSAYIQNDNESDSVGISQSSRQSGIAELRAKLQSFKVSSTVKGSYIAMSAPRPKPGDSMSQSAIELLRNIENTPAVKTGHPVKPNADGKDSSRRALQPISGRPREH